MRHNVAKKQTVPLWNTDKKHHFITNKNKYHGSILAVFLFQ